MDILTHFDLAWLLLLSVLGWYGPDTFKDLFDDVITGVFGLMVGAYWWLTRRIIGELLHD